MVLFLEDAEIRIKKEKFLFRYDTGLTTGVLLVYGRDSTTVKLEFNRSSNSICNFKQKEK